MWLGIIWVPLDSEVTPLHTLVWAWWVLILIQNVAATIISPISPLTLNLSVTQSSELDANLILR